MTLVIKIYIDCATNSMQLKIKPLFPPKLVSYAVYIPHSIIAIRPRSQILIEIPKTFTILLLHDIF